MKITILDEKGNSKFKFNSSNVIQLSYSYEQPSSFMPIKVAKKVWNDVEIKSITTTPTEYQLYNLVKSGEVIRLKLEGGVSCYLTGYFHRLDTQIDFNGKIEATLAFRVMEATLCVMDKFEAAMLYSHTTSDAIEAAIRLAGRNTFLA